MMVQWRKGHMDVTFIVDVGLKIKSAVAGEVGGEVAVSEVAISKVAIESCIGQRVIVQPHVPHQGVIEGGPPHTLLPKVPHEELEADEGEDAQAEDCEDHDI